MPCEDLIDVRVLVDGVPLQEYLDPGNEDTPYSMTRFIEVKAGQKFQHQVKWLAGFNLRYAPFLYFALEIDDNPAQYPGLIAKASCQHRKGSLLHDRFSIRDSLLVRDDITGGWQDCSFVFGALGITDDAQPEIAPEILAKLGSLRVAIYRAQAVPMPFLYVCDGTRPKIIEQVNEKMMKGREIKNNVLYSPGRPSYGPEIHHNYYLPINGQHGTVYKFAFMYRSRKILQSTGCIPRNPSPEPDTRPILERTEEMLRAAKQEKREMNLRYLQLQKELARSRSQPSGSSDAGWDSNASTALSCRETAIKQERTPPKFGTPAWSILPSVFGTKRPRERK